MNRSKTLEEYLKGYVNNKQYVRNPAPTAKNAIKFSEAISRAVNERKLRDAGYGAEAERLASTGLSQSGYKDYLERRNNALFKNELDDALDEKISGEIKSAMKHAELENERAKNVILGMDKVVRFAYKNSITDFDELYNYALGVGLSEYNAKEAAENGVKKTSVRIRSNNIEKTRNAIVSKRLTKTQAYEYAISLGLSEEDALELSKLAYKINQDSDYIIGDEIDTPIDTNKDEKINTAPSVSSGKYHKVQIR